MVNFNLLNLNILYQSYGIRNPDRFSLTSNEILFECINSKNLNGPI